MITMELKRQSTKDNVILGLQKAMSDYEIAALTKKEGKILFDYISDVDEIELDYSPTVLSPKKFFFPKEEVILEYTTEGK